MYNVLIESNNERDKDMNNANWIDTFIEEKELDLNHDYEVQGEGGLNIIPLGCIIEMIKTCGAVEFGKIKATLVKIDFLNGDVHHFFNYLAQGAAQ